MTGTTDVDTYLANVPEEARSSLGEIRRITKDVAPDAVELVGYGIPGFKYQGKPLVYYAALKQHCAVYGLSTEIAEQAGHDTSQKGTIRFPPDTPPPESLLRELLGLRLQAIDDAAARRKKPAGGAKK